MENTMKKLGAVILAMALLWACSKDDGPTPTPEPEPMNSAPVIAAQEFTAGEDISDTSVIGTVTATDSDGDELAFILKADPDGLFEISATGELSLADEKALDFESKVQHSITVEVGDGEKTATATVTIKVTNAIESLAEDPASFVTTWMTTVANEEVVIGTNDAYTYDYTIDWGDGTVEQIANSDPPSHVYANAGTHTVAIKGQFPSIYSYDEMGEKTTSSLLMSIEQWGTAQWMSMESAFYDCQKMVYNATDVPDLSQVTNMYGMFSGAGSFNGDLSDWDTSNVTDMRSMFYGAGSFNGDISGWDTANVTDMSYMFYQATSFNGDISNWDTSNVTNMQSMFYNTSFNGDISGWDTSNVTIMKGMFYGATAFNGDIGNWDTANVTDMSFMLYDATSFNGNISNWDTAKVTDMSYMFYLATSFNGDLSGWDTSNVTDMQSMFSRATSFNGDLSDWDTSNVTNMQTMFYEATAFNGQISGWDTSNVTNMYAMFYGAIAFNRILSNWDISSVQTMGSMLDNSGMSALNFSNTLIGWANLAVQPNVALGAAGVNICENGGGFAAYAALSGAPNN
ncbi:BspA family leucine-rich repeat surface protein, partial [Flagellimonas baculiformis]|uniref:BspA family leucine-rich repeat surface protein n=1 Tax=Flagellimonas baculiformis TaxID=3067310 RepID=UPI00296E3EEC